MLYNIDADIDAMLYSGKIHQPPQRHHLDVTTGHAMILYKNFSDSLLYPTN